MKGRRFPVLFGSISIALVVAVLLLGACSGNKPEATTTPAKTTAAATTTAPKTTSAPTTAAWKPPAQIGVATSETGGSGYNMVASYGPIMEKFMGIPVRVTPDASEVAELTLIKEQGYTFLNGPNCGGQRGMAEGLAYFADEKWGPQRVVNVWFALKYAYGPTVLGNSKIKTMADLKGTRLAWRLDSVGWQVRVEASLAFAGLTKNDVTLVPCANYGAHTQAVVEGRADWGSFGTALAATMQVAETPGGLRWIPMPMEDKAGWGRYLKVDPTSYPGLSWEGVKSSIGVPMHVTPQTIYTLEDKDPELIYRICKFFDEHYNDYKDGNIFNKYMSLEENKNFIPLSPFAWHAGTIRYFKEKGIWNADAEKYNNESLALMEKYKTAWGKAVAEAKAKNIKIDYTNTAWMDLWKSYTKDISMFMMRS